MPDSLFTQASGVPDIDTINSVLAKYGRALYSSGRPYAHFSETLNAFSSQVPKMRRLLQPSWDVAFAWRRAEPGSHHVAMPWQVLVAFLAVALCWGWPRFAGAMALAWGGILRVGELLEAKRKDLLLPKDVNGTIDFAILSIKEPKTRFSAARHQSARLDQPDLLQLVSTIFGSFLPEEKLWPASGQTLRNRFKQVAKALGVPTTPGKDVLHLELASLRAGGATWLMLASDNPDLVRRRGRWINSKVTEIYVQEVSALQLLPKLSFTSRQLVFGALEQFSSLWEKVRFFAEAKIPPKVWYSLIAAGTRLDHEVG